MTAATLTALMRNGAQFAAGAEAEPAAILARLDEGLRGHAREATCTALCVRLEHERLVLGIRRTPSGAAGGARRRGLEKPAPRTAAGCVRGRRLTQEEVSVAPGDAVLLYTDGLTAALGGPAPRPRSPSDRAGTTRRPPPRDRR